MTQPDRAAIDAMTKALDAVFGRRTPRYVKGDQIDDIPLGRRFYADDIESLGRAGATPAQMKRLIEEFAQVDPVSAKMILARDRYRHQRAAITNQQDVAAIRKEFLAKHTKSNEKHGTVGAVESLPNLVAKYGEQSVKDMGYFARQKQILSHPRVIKDALEQSFLGNVRYTGKPTKWGKFKEIGKQVGVVESGVAHNLKLIEELNRVGKVFMDYRFNIRDIRERERGGSALGNATIANMLKSMPTRSSHPYRGQAALTPIKLPTNPLAGIRGLAEQFVKERALSGFSNVGSVISRSNVMKQMSRAANRNTPAITPPLINFPTRATHKPTLFDRFRESKLGRRLGYESTNPVNYKAAGAGLAGAATYLAYIYGPQAIDALSGGFAQYVSGFFAKGGQIPRYMDGNAVKYRHFQMGKPLKGWDRRIGNNLIDQMDTYNLEGSANYRIYATLEHLNNMKKGNLYHGVMAAYDKNYYPVGGLAYTDLGPREIHLSDLGSTYRGVGSALFNNLVNFGTLSGFKKLTWDSLDDPNTLNFYNKRGKLKNLRSLSYERDLTKPFMRASGGSVPRFDSGGDTFNTPLAQGMNSQIATDAVKRLQLLRIRAQAGQRLKGLRGDAQLNMQMGNTSLFRSPNTAAGIINSRVLNNLSSIFSGQKGSKFALGGVPRFDGGGDPQGLTPKQREALAYYRANGFVDITEYLNKGKTRARYGFSTFDLDNKYMSEMAGYGYDDYTPSAAFNFDMAKSMIPHLDEVTKMHTSPNNILYKGISDYWYKFFGFKSGLRQGSIIDIPSFLSTSTSFDVSRRFRESPAMLAIHSNENTLGYYTGDVDREKEFIFPRNSKFRFESLENADDDWNKIYHFSHIIDKPVVNSNIQKSFELPDLLTQLSKGPLSAEQLQAYLSGKKYARGGSIPGYKLGTPNGIAPFNFRHFNIGRNSKYIKQMFDATAPFRGLFYRKGLNTNEWMEKVHQMKLQQASTFMNGYFANGGQIPRYANGTPYGILNAFGSRNFQFNKDKYNDIFADDRLAFPLNHPMTNYKKTYSEINQRLTTKKGDVSKLSPFYQNEVSVVDKYTSRDISNLSGTQIFRGLVGGRNYGYNINDFDVGDILPPSYGYNSFSFDDYISMSKFAGAPNSAMLRDVINPNDTGFVWGDWNYESEITRPRNLIYEVLDKHFPYSKINGQESKIPMFDVRAVDQLRNRDDERRYLNRALGGSIPGYAKGTSDEIPFNFKHFSIGRNSKFIKQMFDLSAPYMNDSDGQYQMFRAIENKKMGPKDFGLFTALNGMDPVSALSYQSDGSGIEMTDLGTHPAFQGRGLAKSLIGQLFNQGQSMGVDTAYWSAKDDASASFYNHLGAKNEGDDTFSFDLNKWKGRFAKGGGLSSLSNPIRVSDGELAISRGMVDKIGLDTLRKINSGDVSAAFGKGFARGGIFEYDGPGTGTSDSILEDADKGPRGKDASDIGFIIKRSSSDKLKGLLGGGFSKLSGIKGFYGGGIPGFAGGNATPAGTINDGIWGLLQRKPDWVIKNGKQKRNYKAIETHYADLTNLISETVSNTAKFSGSGEDLASALKSQITDKGMGLTESIARDIGLAFDKLNGRDLGFADIIKNVFTDQNVTKGIAKLKNLDPNVAFKDIYNKMGNVYGIDPLEPPENNRNKDAEQKNSDAIDKNTKAREKQTTQIYKSIEELSKMDQFKGKIGRYAGQIEWTDPRKVGDAHPTNVLGMDIIAGQDQRYSPSYTDLISQGLGAKSLLGGSILNPFGSRWKGFWGDVNANMSGMGQYAHTKTHNVATINRTVGGDYTGENDRAYMEQMARDAESDIERITGRFTEVFGPLFGDRFVQSALNFNREKNITDDVIVAGYDDKGNEILTSVRRDIDKLSVDYGAIIDEGRRRGMDTAEIERQSQVILEPSTQAQAGTTRRMNVPNEVGGFDAKKIDSIKGATKELSRFDEKVKGIAHNERLLYKFGDAMRGLSWRFASLSMSAMGVYFSIQGLMMTFQQGLSAIVSPLTDVETLLKNIGMSTAFGAGIMNASEAMKSLGLNTDNFIDGWKNITNIQGTIQTLFGGIAAKMFSGEEGKAFTNELLVGIKDAFVELDNQNIGKTVKDLIQAIVEALPAIIPAIGTITAMLQVLADNKFLVEWGAQLMMISLILQPLTSGIAALVTTIGGVSTITSEFYSVSKAIGASATAMKGLSAATVGIAMEVALLLLAWEGVARVIEYITKSHIDLKPSTMIAGAFGLQGFSEGGIVRSEGYDMVPGHPDDTIITAKAGEMVINPKKLQGFADAPGFIAPSAVYTNKAEQTYKDSRNITLLEDGNRTAYDIHSVMDEVQNGDSWNVTVKNWPAMWKEGGFDEREFPFDIGTIIPEKLYGYNFNPNVDAGNPNVNPHVKDSVNPLVNWLVNIIENLKSNVNIKDDAKENIKEDVKDDAKDKSKENVNVVEPNESLVQYIIDTIGHIYKVISNLGNSIVQSVQNTVGVINSTLIGTLDILMEKASVVSEVIGNLIVSLSKLEVIQPIKDIGKSIIDSVSNLPQTIKGIPQKAFDIGTNAINLRSPGYEDIKYHYAGYRKWGDVTDYGPIGTKTTTAWDKFTQGKHVYPVQPQPPSKGTRKKVPTHAGLHGMDIWPGLEKWMLDFPVDFGPILRRTITSDSDPYSVALELSSALAENAMVGYGLSGMQRISQSAPSAMSKVIGQGPIRNLLSSSIGKGAGAIGAMGTEFMGLINQPYITIPSTMVEGQQAMDKWIGGQEASEFKKADAEYNPITGIITGGFVDAAFGKGIEVLSEHFDKSEEQMRKEVTGSWASDLGLNTLWELIAGLGDIDKGKETLSDFGEKAKGGNLAISEKLRDIIPDSLKIEDVPLLGTISAEGIATAFNEAVFDVASTLANLNVKGLTGAGTSFIGMGAAGVELGQNTQKMMSENPWMAAFLGTTSLPFVGPIAASMLMPQTSEWLLKSDYGKEDIVPISETDPLLGQVISILPESFVDANVPVVSGLDTVNQSIIDINAPIVSGLDTVNKSIIDGNSATVSAIKSIQINVEPIESTKQSLAKGGIIGGQNTSTIDDKIGVLPNGDKIAVDEGEFVVRKDVAMKYGAQLQALNSTGKWPKGYDSGGIIGDLKTIFHPVFGSDNIYSSLEDTILKDLQSKYKPGSKIQYNFVKDSPKEFRNIITQTMKNMPVEMQKALAASNKKLTFSHEPTIGGKFPKYDTSSSGTLGRITYGKNIDNIFVKHAGQTEAQQSRTALHEIIHSIYKSSGLESQGKFDKSLTEKGYSWVSSKDPNYWFRNSEIAARSSQSITPGANRFDTFKPSLRYLNRSINNSLGSIENPIVSMMNNIEKVIDNTVLKGSNIKLPSMSSIERTMVSTFNKVGTSIDNAVIRMVENINKNVGSLVSRSPNINVLGKDWGLSKLNMDKIFKTGKGLLRGSTTDPLMFTPSEFQRELELFAKDAYKNNPAYYQDMWSRGETGISGGSPSEQLLTNWNKDIAEFIYGNRDYLKEEREAFLKTQENIIKPFDTSNLTWGGIIRPEQQGIDISNLTWGYTNNKIEQQGIDLSNLTWGYNNSKIERQIAEYQEQMMNQPILSYQDLSEKSNTYGKIHNVPNLESGWWTRGQTGPIKYFEDPNDNKYAFGMNDIDTSKYFTGYDKVHHPAPEYIGGSQTLGSYNPITDVISTMNNAISTMDTITVSNINTNSITDASGPSTNQQVQTTQPIIVQITVSGEELATKGYIERYIENEVPNIMRYNQSRII